MKAIQLTTLALCLNFSACSKAEEPKPGAEPATTTEQPEKKTEAPAEPKLSVQSRQFTLNDIGFSILFPASWNVIDAKKIDQSATELHSLGIAQRRIVFDCRSARPEQLGPTDTMSWIQIKGCAVPKQWAESDGGASKALSDYLNKGFEGDVKKPADDMVKQGLIAEGTVRLTDFTVGSESNGDKVFPTTSYHEAVKNLVAGNTLKADYTSIWFIVEGVLVQVEAKSETQPDKQVLAEMIKTIRLSPLPKSGSPESAPKKE